MNLKIWGQAVTTMPAVSAAQWAALDIVGRWLIATRASVLLMTFSSAAIGGLLAWRDQHFDIALWLLTTIGLLLAHATNNLLNDLIDSARGIDKGNYYRNQYGVHVLEDGLLSRNQLLRYIAFTGGLALLCGGILVMQRGGITLGLLAAGMFFAVFYTWPLKYIGLGEPAVLLVWGPLMIGGSYFVVSGIWSWHVALLSLLFALGPTSVLFGKHIDKLDLDRAKRVHSLPVILGERNARLGVIVMLVAQYLITGLIIANGYFGWPLALVFINLVSLKRLVGVFKKSKPQTRPERFPTQIWPLWFSAHAFDHTRKFSGLLLLALLLECVLLPK